MMHDPFILVLLVGIALLAVLSWDRGCRCEKCAYHVNDRRVTKARAEEAKREDDAKQAHLRHEAEHKGFGWRPGDSDIYDCHEEVCPRNRGSR